MINKYIFINKYGITEEMDLLTGESTPKEIPVSELPNYEVISVNGKPRWVDKKLNQRPDYTPAIGELFVFHILNGKGVMAACNELGITYGTYCSWKRRNREFNDMVNEARKDRAERLFDKIEETVEAVQPIEEEIALGRLKVDAYKHLSGVSDPSRFGTKTQVSGTIGVARLVVDTGITRTVEGAQAEVFGRIEEQQKAIEAVDRNQATFVMKKPEGMPMSEVELGKMEDAVTESVLAQTKEGIKSGE